MNNRDHTPNSCASCGVYDCFRNVEKKLATTNIGRTAFLVDQYWPEFDGYMQQVRQSCDWLLTPFNGGRFRKPQYAWNQQGYQRVSHLFWVTLRRAWQLRRLAHQGAVRQRHIIDFDEKIAIALGNRLNFMIEGLVVWQAFLLPLHRHGFLGGRHYDVFMHRLPYQVLQHKLDNTAKQFPQSLTLNDFRVPAAVVQEEWKLLEQANRIITPHAYMAKLFPEKTILLKWQIPTSIKPAPPIASPKVVFIGPTAGRRGAYVMRKFLDHYPISLTVLGRNVEQPNFWQGYKVTEELWHPNWLADVGLVISLAHIDHQPRRLLEAVAAGVSIIARTESGLLQPIQLTGTHPDEQKIQLGLEQIGAFSCDNQ
ncbi:MAG: hypothetical protein JNK86_01030 [Alphaproteobacteria bacterium]|nr:hypothetical protein [Alphaproteobacteria bacterium]